MWEGGGMSLVWFLNYAPNQRPPGCFFLVHFGAVLHVLLVLDLVTGVRLTEVWTLDWGLTKNEKQT